MTTKRRDPSTTPIIREPNLKLPNAPWRPAISVANAREEAQSGRTQYPRLCLKFVRQMHGLPMLEPTAISAWKNAKSRHKWTGDTDDIPYGAPVFAQRPNAGADDAGHVFIAGGRDTDGERIFWSNDIVTLGGISPVRITAFSEKWGQKILGWTDDLNGFDLNLPKSPNARKRSK